jgi:membrane protein YqaA with SNARE-associated domain
MPETLLVYLSLFGSSFLAATILPLQSEAVLLGVLFYGYDPTTALIIASTGNVLGGCTNYALGYWGNKKISNRNIKYAAKWKPYIDSYGAYTAFFSWLPFIGDLLLVLLGYLKTPFLSVFIFMTFGKVLRYLIICLPFYV